MLTARSLCFVLVGLVVLIQYPLWLGKGGWLRVWDLDRQQSIQKGDNLWRVQRNAALEADVRDLQIGTVSIEERARYELGMVRAGEVFVLITEDAEARDHEIRTVTSAPGRKPGF
jgi:cell division protein FtsB